MSEEPNHGATVVRASKGGGAKWLWGSVAAIVLLGGAYLAWTNYAPSQTNTDIAASDPYASEPLHAGPLAPSEDATAQSNLDDSVTSASASDTAPASASVRRTPRRTVAANVVPEETVGITPVSLTTDNDDIIVHAPRRAVWTRTPSARRLSGYYPERALEDGREGEASLHCIVQTGGALDCERVAETPGFGGAAMAVARGFRHASTRADGSSAIGTPVNLHVVFRLDDGDRHARG